MLLDKHTKKPMLISHRGAHREAPENSCQGFELALGYGVDGIETDVQLSRDGVPVLYHDPTAWRLTTRRKRISSYTLDELQALERGRGRPGDRIPILAEALAQFGGKTDLFLEIKSSKPDRRAGRSLTLTDKVVAQVGRLSAVLQKKISVLSFDPDVLMRVNRSAPNLKCVLNTDGKGSWCVPVADLMGGRVSMDFLHAVCLEKKYLSPQVITWAHTRDLAVMTYCCNTRPQVMRALDLGVDGIMSDKPGWLVSTVKTLRSEARGQRSEDEG
jgi:glycerophosphoryl diester phosphodiesterase